MMKDVFERRIRKMMIVVFVIFQKQFMQQGITDGSIKG